MMIDVLDSRRQFVLVTALFFCSLFLGCSGDAESLDAPDVDTNVAKNSATRDPIADEQVHSAVPQAPGPATPGTKQMANILKTLALKADPRATPSIGPRFQIAEYMRRFQQERRPGPKVVLQSHLGWQLLRDGQTKAALKVLGAAQADLSLLGLPEDHEFFRNFHELVGIANLRLAEQENCIAHHGCDSCILPIQGDGIHRLRAGAETARAEFAGLLQKDPADLRSRWLLNLAYMTLGEYPDQVPKEWLIPPAAFDSDFDVSRFHDVAVGAGVDTLGLSGGVVMDDFDSDGLLDLMVSDWGVDKQLRLYTNRGDGTFVETTEAAGLAGEVGGLNLVQADYDNDGHVDVLVLRGAWLQDNGQYPNSLLRNLGDGRFDDVTERAGIMSYCPTQTAAWGDYDLDGFLDLFIGNETHQSQTYPCQLYHNNGDGTFTDVAADVGLAHEGFVKGVVWGDVDNDLLPDLYLSCFGEPNLLFHNEGPTEQGWRFRDITERAGVGQPLASFPTWFWDYDNDGWVDLLVAPFSGFEFDGKALRIAVEEYLKLPTTADRLHLYRNNGDGTFTNVAPSLGIDAPLLAMGANFGDLDNDGFLDGYFGTGDPHLGTLVPNRMFRNDAGKAFQDVTTSGGFGHIQKGHGIAFGDVDNDGDQDVYAVMGGALAGDVYQNVLFHNPGHGNHWITLRLEGSPSNRFAIGARVRVTVASPTGRRDIHVTVGSGGSFGASSLQQEIGLGNAIAIENLEVRWPSTSRVQNYADVKVDQAYRVREGQDKLAPVALRNFRWAPPDVPDHTDSARLPN